MFQFRILFVLTLLLCPMTNGLAFWKVPPGERDQGRVDSYGDPLPDRAVARLGTSRFRHPGSLHAVACSRDGKLVAAASASPSVVRIWDRESGKLLDQWRFADSRPPEQLVFSPTGQRLYAGRLSERERLWSVWDLSRRAATDLGPIDERSVPFQSLTPDGRHAILASGEQIVCWDLSTDRMESTFNRPERRVADCAHAAGIGWVAICHSGTNYTATQLKDGKELWSQVGDWDGVLPNQPVTFANDGRRVAIRTEAGRIKVIETSTGKILTSIKGSEGAAVHAMTFSPDGATLVVSWRFKGLRLYDTLDGTHLASIATSCGDPVSIAFAPDSKSLATASPEGAHAVQFFDSARGTRIDRSPGHTTPISAVAITADGSEVATAGSSGGEPLLAVWNAYDGKQRWASNDGTIADVAFSPDQAKLATPIRVKGNPIRLWDVRTGHIACDLDTSGDSGGSIVFYGNELLLGGMARRVSSWNVRKAMSLQQRLNVPRGIDRIVASPDGQYAIVTTPEVYVCDLKTGRTKGPVIPFTKSLSGMSLSPDGRLLATADGSNVVRLWEVLTWNPAGTIEIPGSVAAIAFAPSGHTIAAATSGGTVLCSLSSARSILTLHSGPTPDTLVSFSANGQRLVTAGNSESVAMVWDVSDKIVHPAPTPAIAHQIDCESCWADLMNSDPKIGYAAVWKLVAVSDRSVTFLAGKLGKSIPNAEQLDRHIGDLNNSRFAVRERAMRELVEVGETAVGRLRETRRQTVSAEQAERIDVLLKTLDSPIPSPGRLRASRTVAILEIAKGSQARKILEEAAKGPEGSALTREAKAALARWN